MGLTSAPRRPKRPHPFRRVAVEKFNRAYEVDTPFVLPRGHGWLIWLAAGALVVVWALGHGAA